MLVFGCFYFRTAFNIISVKNAQHAPRKMPTIVKKLTEAPASPFNSSFTNVGAIPKHKVVPIPLVSANNVTLIIIKILVKIWLYLPWK